MNKQRDIWVDNVKIFACILVVLGHFFQSMVKADIIRYCSLYKWFNTTIYYFHVPLFFICSGYLYQKYSAVRSFNQWKNSVLKKFFALGIPYFVFSMATWLLKNIFSSSVNSQLGGLGYTLIKNPTAPYWYLYVLFIIFVITLTAKNKIDSLILFGISFLCKMLTTFGVSTGIYAIDTTASHWFWFVAGMLLATELIPVLNRSASVILLAFVAMSIVIHNDLFHFKGEGFLLGILACYSIISIIYHMPKPVANSKILSFSSKYTMPVFLMHTLFAAPLRSLLLKLGLNNSIFHVCLGLLVSFVGPIIAMVIMEKLHPLDIIVYPNRYIKIKSPK